MKVHTWAPVPGCNQMIRVNSEHAGPGDEARRVADQLQRRQPGERLLLVGRSVPDLDLSDFPRLVAMGPFLQWLGAVVWWEEFYWRLHELAAPPVDAVCIDDERGFTYWHLTTPDFDAGLAKIAELYADTSLQRLLPHADPRAFADFRSAAGRRAVIAFNTFAGNLLANWIRAAVVTPHQRATGVRVKLSMYHAANVRTAVDPPLDGNGWPYTDVAAIDVSTPSLYPRGPGDLSRVFATAGKCRKPMWPYLAFPSWHGAGEEAYRNLFKGVRVLGAEHVLIWNPSVEGHATDADQAAIARIVGGG